MHTQCPECNTVFRITEAQLNAAGGRVRCGECHSVFNARQHLFERMPSAAAAEPAPAAPPPRAAPQAPAARTRPPAATAPSAEPADVLFAGEAETVAERTEDEDSTSALDDFLAAKPQQAVGDTAEFDALFEGEAKPTTESVGGESASAELDEFLTTADQAADAATARYEFAADELDALLEGEAAKQPAAEEGEANALDDFLATEPQETPSATTGHDTQFEAEAETTAESLGGDSASAELDEFLATADQAADAATARYEIAADELDALLDAAEHEADQSSPAPAVEPTQAPVYEVDLDEFFAGTGEEESTELFAAEPPETFTDTHAATEGVTTAPAPTDDLFGEAQIESLLNPQDAENLELPWERDETERPAVVIDLSEDETATRDEFRDLGLSSSGNEVDEFDLPEAQLTSARPLPPESPASVSPSALPDLLASEAAAPARSLAGILGWVLGSLLLLTLLTAQYGYLNRELLVLRYPQLRPALELACHYTGCELPPRRDLGAITLLERDIRSHTSYQGALVITATLLNRADFAQPYPDVEVIMRDLGGNIVAARRFRPDQYLSGTHPAQLASQATAQLLLEVSDPGAAAVGFEFNFY